MASTLRIEIPVGGTIQIKDRTSVAVNRIIDKFTELNGTVKEGDWLLGKFDRTMEKVEQGIQSGRKAVSAFDEALGKSIKRINQLAGMKKDFKFTLNQQEIISAIHNVTANIQVPLEFLKPTFPKDLFDKINIFFDPDINVEVNVINEVLVPEIVYESEPPVYEGPIISPEVGKYIVSGLGGPGGAGISLAEVPKDLASGLALLTGALKTGSDNLKAGTSFYSAIKDLTKSSGGANATPSAGSNNYNGRLGRARQMRDQVADKNTMKFAAGATSVISILAGGASITRDLLIANKSYTDEADKAKHNRNAVTKTGMIATGAMIGSIVPGVGTAFGALVGAGMGAAAAVSSGDSISDWIGTVLNAKDKQKEALLEMNENLKSSFSNFKTSVQDAQYVELLVEELDRLTKESQTLELSTEGMEEYERKIKDISLLLQEIFPEVISDIDIISGNVGKKVDYILQTASQSTQRDMMEFYQTKHELRSKLPEAQDNYLDYTEKRDNAYETWETQSKYRDELQVLKEAYQAIETSGLSSEQKDAERERIKTKAAATAAYYGDGTVISDGLSLDNALSGAKRLAAKSYEEYKTYDNNVKDNEDVLKSYYHASLYDIFGDSGAEEVLGSMEALSNIKDSLQSQDDLSEHVINQIAKIIPDFDTELVDIDQIKDVLDTNIEELASGISGVIEEVKELNEEMAALPDEMKVDLSFIDFDMVEEFQAEDNIVAFQAEKDSRQSQIANDQAYQAELEAIIPGVWKKMSDDDLKLANEIAEKYGKDVTFESKKDVKKAKNNIEAEIEEAEEKLKYLDLQIEDNEQYLADQKIGAIETLTANLEILEAAREAIVNGTVDDELLADIQAIIPQFTYNADDAEGALSQLDGELTNIWSTLRDAITDLNQFRNDLKVLDGEKVNVSMEVQAVINARLNGINAGGAPHYANGGILSTPHMGLVAEDGPEAIIPLSGKRRQRGLDLWQEAGERLGVLPYSEGGIIDSFTNTASGFGSLAGIAQLLSSIFVDSESEDEISPMSMTQSAQKNEVQVNVQLSPTFQINQDGGATVNNIKAQLNELIDDMAGEIADKLNVVFSNMPMQA